METNHNKNKKEVHSMTHRDNTAVHKLFKAVIDSSDEYQSITDWLNNNKRELIAAQDEAPEDVAKSIANEYEAEAKSKRARAQELREDADELESEAIELREIAADVSLDEDGGNDTYTREDFVEELVSDAEVGQQVIVVDHPRFDQLSERANSDWYEFAEEVRDTVRDESESDDIFVNEAGLEARDML